MRRRQTFFSLPALIIFVILFTGLGMTLWRSGGLAFSPGDLSAKSNPGVELRGFTSHAKFERECSYCHQPLKTVQANLCLACHVEVSSQITSGKGIHATFEQVSACAQCHSDHRGRNFDPLLDAMDNFDHSTTTFDLIHHQVDYDASLIDCQNCHLVESNYAVSVEACASCHAAEDMAFMVKHIQDFGDGCLECHDGIDKMVGFDHSATVFPLLGKHESIECVKCHTEKNFANTPKDCVACHAEPQIHAGSFDLDCSLCHTAQAWKPASLDGRFFDHTDQTAFSLVRHTKDFADQAITCKGCHPEDFKQFDQDTCINCHNEKDPEYMNAHIEKFGNACLGCHDGVDRMREFDHAKFFPLDGRHAEVDCESCHIDYVFKGTPKVCIECHAEPEIHEGVFGVQCQSCHTTTAWSPAQLQVHTFPIDHGERGDQACSVCHQDVYFEYTCYSCHDHQPDLIQETHLEQGISLQELPNCVQCHPDGK